MKITGTKHAFYTLINVRGISSVLNLGRQTISTWKGKIEKEGGYPKEDTMRRHLKAAGAKPIKDEVIWQIPDDLLNK